jgi:hypothetical protein
MRATVTHCVFRPNVLMFSHNLRSTLAARQRDLERGHYASARIVGKQESGQKKMRGVDAVLFLSGQTRQVSVE